MKKQLFTRMVFVGKSMLWALALYIGAMLVFNWDEVRSTTSRDSVVLVKTTEQAAVKVATTPDHQNNILKSALTLVKAICGISALGK